MIIYVAVLVGAGLVWLDTLLMWWLERTFVRGGRGKRK